MTRTLANTVEHTAAYKNGYKSGKADALRRHRSLYAWVTFATDPDYHKQYSSGYRVGWTEVYAHSEAYGRGVN